MFPNESERRHWDRIRRARELRIEHPFVFLFSCNPCDCFDQRENVYRILSFGREPVGSWEAELENLGIIWKTRVEEKREEMRTGEKAGKYVPGIYIEYSPDEAIAKSETIWSRADAELGVRSAVDAYWQGVVLNDLIA